MTTTHPIRTEIRTMLALALPVILDHIGGMSMGIADTILVGKLGQEALAAVGITNSLYYFFMVFAYGALTAIAPTVAHAHGAGNHDEIGEATGQGFWIVAGLWVVGMVAMWNAGPILLMLKQKPSVVALAEQYIRALSIGMIANLIYANLRAFTVGLGKPRVTMTLSFIGAAINIPLAYLLIFGGLGIPPLGGDGGGDCNRSREFHHACNPPLLPSPDRRIPAISLPEKSPPPNVGRIMNLLKLGVPIGMGNSMEQGVFGLTSIVMGMISTVAVASHQIAISVAAFTFMTPLGVATATTTRVGNAMGRRDPNAAALAGWVGVGIGGAFMCLTGLIFVIFSGQIVMLYTTDQAVVEYAGGLLAIAGAFQLSDGLQVTAMGALRGMKDTTVPMVTNLVAYWLLGLPTGLLFCFVLEMGGYGLWWGLTIGLSIAAVLHSLRFRTLVRKRPDASMGESSLA
ncbi:MAG: MATE family multidrug resistance protein [Chlorobi bacterium OLB7]|nr:MAG: MATE family multidrug resistance protein [Chlorobi bacterium OLB7]